MKRRRSPAISDTSPDAQEVLLRLMSRAPAWRKLEVVSDLNRGLRELVLSEMGERHPHASEEELRVLLAERLYGAEVARAVKRARRGR